MSKLVRTLSMLFWMLPITILVWLFYIFPIWALGWIRLEPWPVKQGKEKKDSRFLVARFLLTSKSAWYLGRWKGYAGNALPHAILVKHKRAALEAHELRHITQWFILGPLFLIVYLIFLIGLGYKDNPLEVDASNCRLCRK